MLQTPLWEPEAAWELVRERELRATLALDEDAQRWPVSRARLEESGAFRRVRELVLHSVEWGDGDRLLGFVLSEGSMTTLLETGVTEADVPLDRLRVAAAQMGDPVPWWIGYRAWIGQSDLLDDELDRADERGSHRTRRTRSITSFATW